MVAVRVAYLLSRPTIIFKDPKLRLWQMDKEFESYSILLKLMLLLLCLHAHV